MIGALVVLYIWAAGLIAFGLVFSYVTWRYFKKAKEYHKAQEDLLKAAEIKTKKEYNKIATLPFKEFTDFLVVAFSRMLILSSDANVSESPGPNAHEELYMQALARLIEYLGEETVTAIEYYYGKGYLARWCKEAYRYLEYAGVATSIIKKERDVASVARRISEGY